ncbi:MAG: RNA-binding S4 domain-containing protein [Clostridia bacterium]|nr:RNA-binding S4 domain-containing protein [Clostridia bacterium]
MEKVSISTEYIKLGQLLKLASIVSNGSDAKLLIADGQVSLNGEVVYERGKKVHPGDRVDVKDMGSIIVE